jgi:hypothetical protein
LTIIFFIYNKKASFGKLWRFTKWLSKVENNGNLKSWLDALQSVKKNKMGGLQVTAATATAVVNKKKGGN